MTEANERVLEQLRRARDAGDNLEAALRARIAAEQDPDSRARLSDRLREVQAHSGAIEGRLGVLTPSPSPIDLGVTVATLPLRVGVNAAKAVVGEALSLALGAMELSGDRGREGDPVR